MALRATIYKADLNVADTDRHYYGTHGLTVARHPSETDERMMVRLVAFALHASEELAFTKGLSDTDEPDLWEKDLTGAVKLWIEVGQPRNAASCAPAAAPSRSSSIATAVRPARSGGTACATSWNAPAT